MAKATPNTKGATNAKAGTTSAPTGSPAATPTPAGNAGAEALASAGTTDVLATQTNSSQAGIEGGAEKATPTTAPVAPAAQPDPKATRSYGVGSVPIRHNGAFYGVGYEVQLTYAQADRLGNLVTLIPETPEE